MKTQRRITLWAMLPLLVLMAGGPRGFALPGKVQVNAGLSTVKIINTYTRVNPYQPWRWSNPLNAMGSGIVIEGNRILTNAHIVSDSTFLQVQKENDPRYYDATVLFLGHDCDLALIAVKDTKFFNGTAPLPLGGIPPLQSKVAALGYPEGGERISVTQGIVSRIEINQYSHSGKASLLSIQTDAAINPGNSGGPVVQGGKCVGVTFQARTNASNIGFMIPMPVVKHFLEDIKDGSYDGFPSLGIFVQELQSQSMREFLGMGKNGSGILVTHVLPGGSANGSLFPGDIIMRINGIPIANDGTYKFMDGRVRFTNIIDEKQIGQKLAVSVLRKGAVLHQDLTMKQTPVRIPWYNEFNTVPRYFIFGGIIFQALSREYLKTWSDWMSNANDLLLYGYLYHDTDDIDPWRKEFVVINHVLPDPCNTYVTGNADSVVDEINGKKISSIEDVLAAVKHPPGKFHVIRLQETSAPILLKVSDIPQADRRIMENYKINRLTSLPAPAVKQ